MILLTKPFPLKMLKLKEGAFTYRWQKVISVVVFGVAFGLLEAIVVIYIREILGTINTTAKISPNDIAISFGAIAFLKPAALLSIINNQRLLTLELWREATTIIMLATLAWGIGTKLWDKLAYFLLAFAFWDIFYYLFLGFLTGRPSGLFSPDIFFLIPVAWIGPVITPVIVSLLLIIWSLFLLRKGV